jgi:signal peptidase I
MERLETKTMTSLAGYAVSPIEAPSPSPRIAALLTMLTPGLGHIYIGQARRGILLFTLVILADILVVFTLMGVLARFWMFATSLALLLSLWVFIIIDAAKRAQQMRDHPRRSYNNWQTYAAAFVIAVVIAALPFLYAAHAQSSGQLGYFPALAPSMEPTVRAGEFVFADATYYRSHQPARGDVVVYVHPKQAGLHPIKRIAAVEGDRIAIKDGRAIVNGMPLEEPYIIAGPPDAPFAAMPEMRVEPGYVFVLGDNRANSVDSRDSIAHGAVPADKLIARVTDIALSRVVSRMGRWIGTPSM